VLDVPGKARVLVFSFGSVTSGIPPEWAATDDRPGVNLLADLSQETGSRMAARIQQAKRPATLLSHPSTGEQLGLRDLRSPDRFAHRLIDEGVDLVHGHSSHHIKALELYRGQPIFYGCGDF
jgi:poly-gamma-glutamate synthesis protein (capsule biosynthesis protein)